MQSSEASLAWARGKNDNYDDGGDGDNDWSRDAARESAQSEVARLAAEAIDALALIERNARKTKKWDTVKHTLIENLPASCGI